MTDPFSKTCDRCGEKYYEKPGEEVFRVAYSTKGYHDIEADMDEPLAQWRALNLCSECQEFLRDEFYDRGLVRHGR